uniref:Uncharacterized protein n=1 Tax=Lygus hesperus TaxID=30085 RepID=A0A0A9WVT4_LYGHE
MTTNQGYKGHDGNNGSNRNEYGRTLSHPPIQPKTIDVSTVSGTMFFRGTQSKISPTPQNQPADLSEDTTEDTTNGVVSAQQQRTLHQNTRQQQQQQYTRQPIQARNIPIVSPSTNIFFRGEQSKIQQQPSRISRQDTMEYQGMSSERSNSTRNQRQHPSSTSKVAESRESQTDTVAPTDSQKVTKSSPQEQQVVSMPCEVEVRKNLTNVGTGEQEYIPPHMQIHPSGTRWPLTRRTVQTPPSTPSTAQPVDGVETHVSNPVQKTPVPKTMKSTADQSNLRSSNGSSNTATKYIPPHLRTKIQQQELSPSDTSVPPLTQVRRTDTAAASASTSIQTSASTPTPSTVPETKYVPPHSRVNVVDIATVPETKVVPPTTNTVAPQTLPTPEATNTSTTAVEVKK